MRYIYIYICSVNLNLIFKYKKKENFKNFVVSCKKNISYNRILYEITLNIQILSLWKLCLFNPLNFNCFIFTFLTIINLVNFKSCLFWCFWFAPWEYNFWSKKLPQFTIHILTYTVHKPHKSQLIPTILFFNAIFLRFQFFYPWNSIKRKKNSIDRRVPS